MGFYRLTPPKLRWHHSSVTLTLANQIKKETWVPHILAVLAVLAASESDNFKKVCGVY
jgi:hypothetical protein